jgi:hypothetical protein
MLHVDQIQTFAHAHQEQLLREAEAYRLIGSVPADRRSPVSLRARLAVRLHQMAYRLEPRIDPIAFPRGLNVSGR